MKYRLLKEAALRELMEDDDNRYNLVSMINSVDEPENYDGMGRPMISKPPKNPLSCAAIEFWVKSKKPRLEPEQYGSMDEIVLAQRYLEENGIDSESLDRETFKAVQRYIAELVSKYGGHRPL